MTMLVVDVSLVLHVLLTVSSILQLKLCLSSWQSALFVVGPAGPVIARISLCLSLPLSLLQVSKQRV